PYFSRRPETPSTKSFSHVVRPGPPCSVARSAARRSLRSALVVLRLSTSRLGMAGSRQRMAGSRQGGACARAFALRDAVVLPSSSNGGPGTRDGPRVDGPCGRWWDALASRVPVIVLRQPRTGDFSPP